MGTEKARGEPGESNALQHDVAQVHPSQQWAMTSLVLSILSSDDTRHRCHVSIQNYQIGYQVAQPN
jgi:predicted transcriptional regulator